MSAIERFKYKDLTIAGDNWFLEKASAIEVTAIKHVRYREVSLYLGEDLSFKGVRSYARSLENSREDK